jgi:hypothetical protein
VALFPIGDFGSFFKKILDNIFKMGYIDSNLCTPALEAFILTASYLTGKVVKVVPDTY